MARAVSLTVLLVLVLSLNLSAQVTITVGTSDSSYNYPTIASAFSAINAGSITDGSGDPADFVTVALMDSFYTEPELRLSGHNGWPRHLVISGHPVAGGGTNAIVNITQTLGTGTGLSVDSVANFAMSRVKIRCDSSVAWNSLVKFEFVTSDLISIEGVELDVTAAIAQHGIEIHGDSGGSFTMENCIVPATRKCLFLHGLGNECSVSSVVLKHNTFNGVGADSGVGIFLERIRCGNLQIDSNKIDMGGKGTGIAVKIPLSGMYDDHDFGANNMGITHATTGIQIELDGDTTGLGGVSPDSLTFGSIEVSDNTMSDVNHSVSVIEQQLSDMFDKEVFCGMILRRNTCTGTGSDSSVGISFDVVPTQIEDKYIFTVEAVFEQNSVSNIKKGIVVELNSDTTGLGGTPVDSLRPGSIEVLENTIDVVGGGSVINSGGIVFAHSMGNQILHGSAFGRISIKRNIISASGDPNVPPLAGIWIDSLIADTLEIDSNSVDNFGRAISVVMLSGDQHWVEIVTMAHNAFGDGGNISLENSNLDFSDNRADGRSLSVELFFDSYEPTIDCRIANNTFTGSAENGLQLTIGNSANDSIRVFLENNSFSGNGGNGLEFVADGDSGLVDAVITGNTFSGNTLDGFLARKGNKSEFGNGNKFGFDKGHGHNNVIDPLAAGSAPGLRRPMSTFSPNEFISNGGDGLHLDSTINVPDGIHYQNFSNNGSYNFFNGTQSGINLEGCWWGTDDSAAIAAKIFDGNDSAGLGACDFTPFLEDSISSSVTQTSVGLSAGWNIVSVPVGVSDYAKSTLFPTAISHAFAYNGSYQSQPTLANGAGYWIKCSASSQQSFSGVTIVSDTIDVVAGWNMIGSISAPVPAAGITSVPGGIVTTQFFRYSGSYSVADTLRPGIGYWVKVNTTGKLIVSSVAGPGNNPNAIHISPSDGHPPAAPGSDVTDPGLPREYSMRQNYPNPFNPTTRISVELPYSSLVTLTIFDILGREVHSIANNTVMEAGTHELEFDGGNISSGMYFYRVTAVPAGGGAAFTQLRRMILVK